MQSFPINSVPQGSLNDVKRSALGTHSVPFPEFIDPFTGGGNHIEMISTLYRVANLQSRVIGSAQRAIPLHLSNYYRSSKSSRQSDRFTNGNPTTPLF